MSARRAPLILPHKYRAPVAYALSPLLVILTTRFLGAIQSWLIHVEGPEHGRIFTTLYFFIIAALTMLGGRGPGLLTVGLSVLATDYFVMQPRYSLVAKSFEDCVQLVLYVIVGSILTLATDALASNRRLLMQSEEARARLRTVMDTAPVGVVLSDMDGKLTYANREAERIWGHPLIPVGPDGWAQYQILDPEGTPIPPNRRNIARALAGEADVVQSEGMVVRPDSVRVHFESSATLIVDATGNRLGALAVMTDISQRKAAEAAARARDEHFRTLVQNASDIITVLDKDGVIGYKSPSEQRVLGYSPEETLGVSIMSLIHPEDQAQVGEFFSEVLQTPGSHPPIEFRIRHKDGHWLTLESVSANLLNDPAVGGIVVNSRDITYRKASEVAIRALLEQVQKKADRESLLNTISQAVLAADSPEAILSATTEALGPALAADRCYYVTYDLPTDIGVLGPDWHRSGLPSIAGEYKMSDYGFNRDAQYKAGQVQIVFDAYALEDGTTKLAECGSLRSLLRVPVQHGPTMTALVVAMSDTTRDWHADEVSLMETIAAQTRVAVEALRLQQREHHIATALQEALMPTLPDSVPGLDLAAFYKPALEESSLGGDFHDVFPLDKGLFALIVGDVSGKGLAAAAQVATVRQMLRYALYLGTARSQSLSQSVSELNQQIVAHELLSGFVTLFVGIYDASASTLAYVSCGQEPALLRRAQGTVDELPPTGPVMGMDIDALYTHAALTLEAGDVLAIYTDGLSEAGRGQGDLLGVEGIAALLTAAPRGPAKAQVTSVMQGVTAHAQGSLHDDACLLVAVAQDGRHAPHA